MTAATPARIYQPARTAMQSGPGKSSDWLLEFTPAARKSIDPLMGWTGSGDMRAQVKLRFASQGAAVAYAQRHSLAYVVVEPKRRRHAPRGYAENFAHNRRASWTH